MLYYYKVEEAGKKVILVKGELFFMGPAKGLKSLKDLMQTILGIRCENLAPGSYQNKIAVSFDGNLFAFEKPDGSVLIVTPEKDHRQRVLNFFII